MEGSSSKEANIISSSQNDQGMNMANLNHPAPPPPYQESQPSTHAYPPQPQPYPQPQYQGGRVIYSPGVVTTQPGVTVMQQTARGPVATTVVGSTIVQTTLIEPSIGGAPALVHCRFCNQQMVTRVEHMPSGRTHIAALLLCLIGCWPLVCLPYCISSCQTAQHYCTNCGAYIGSQ